MIFGAETPEVLETKINNLEEQITDAEDNLKTRKEDLRYYSRTPIGERASGCF